MRIICLLSVILVSLAYFIWAKVRFGDGEKGSFLGFFIPGVSVFVRKVRGKLHLQLKREKYEQLRRMYVGMDETELFCFYYSRMGAVMAAVILLGLSMLTASSALKENMDIIESYYIERRGVADGEKSVSFEADNGTEKRQITVNIPEREYTQAEKKNAFAKVKKEILRALPGENDSLDKVEKPLVLLEDVPGYDIDISWELGQDGLIGEDGTIENEELREPVPREITAVMSCGDEEQRVVQLITVYPAGRTASGRFWASWEEVWKELEESSRTENYVMLPEKVAGKILTYKQEGSSLPAVIFAGMLCCLLLVPLWFENRNREEMNRRQEQLKKDYPEFVEHFVLLIGAGLTVKGTWERIVKDYEHRQGERHYVYEEMALSLREMDCGMSESRAYELFGKRTGLLSYMKFCTLIVQNLRKGSSDLLQLLDYEVSSAFHQRKENARELGEKAGTKLLLPMVVMLALIFVMILYAAFSGM